MPGFQELRGDGLWPGTRIRSPPALRIASGCREWRTGRALRDIASCARRIVVGPGLDRHGSIGLCDLEESWTVRLDERRPTWLVLRGS
jgi:hypothetical protein